MFSTYGQLTFFDCEGKKNKLRSGMVFINHCRFSNTLNLKDFLKNWLKGTILEKARIWIKCSSFVTSNKHSNIKNLGLKFSKELCQAKEKLGGCWQQA